LPLDDLRYQLLESLYRAGATARREMAGQSEAAQSVLTHAAWLAPWRIAVDGAVTRLLAEIDVRFDAAAAESRMPPRALRAAKPSGEDRHAIRARVEAAGIPLERVNPPDRAADRNDALLRAAMALDDSWDRLERVIGEELRSWQADVERVRAWRRPTAALWLITGLALVLAIGLGLSLGGYLPAPGPLGALQRLFWSLPWR
jgi:hypothetical protein